ncbi:MAG: hypothetical protein LBS93_05405 [Synergistaceae bacterium]|nr:hypothetical protein [Synergistaceae bacterium]
MADKKLLLGYLTVEAKDNYFRGAALVTDGRGIPVDFRYTEPVRPTRLERILYGGALDIYLREEVILENLLSAIEAKPALWLVDDFELVRPVQKLSKLPAFVLEPTQRSPLESSGKFETTAEEGVFIFQADNISAPLRLSLSGENVSKVAQTVEILTAAAEDMELMEPFSRIERAFEAVTESES